MLTWMGLAEWMFVIAIVAASIALVTIVMWVRPMATLASVQDEERER